MARSLNPRQLRFASLVASGRMTTVGAFRETYQPPNPRAQYVYRNARRLAAHPGVREKIREFQELFSTEDAEAIRNHAAAVLHHLSVDASERVRLAAATLLYEVSERLQAARDATPPQQGRAMVELGRIYRQLTTSADREVPQSAGRG